MNGLRYIHTRGGYMKIWKLCWVLIKKFGPFGNVDTSVFRYGIETLQDELFEKYGSQVRDKFVKIVNHKTMFTPDELAHMDNYLVPRVGHETTLQFDTDYGVERITR